ncbi:hypothetical protein [Saccharopolyspora sp. NPDC050642]|uniref:hypothetical protein n=1 Tax=Saccharopolyspora sp. NPDC050642 TaxID=3157099 RepID=UPI0033E888EA
MLDPTGPLPPTVYWRRRAVAIGAVVLVVALLGWGAIALLGGASGPQAVPAPPPGPPVAVAADAPPQPCADESMRVVAEVARPEFKVGERVGMSVVVTNASDRACVRDINRLLRELTVSTPGGKHVWSSNDCYSESTNEQPLLQPGQSVRNDIQWSGQTSTSDCEDGQAKAQAGDYQVVARLAALNSSPTPFRLTAAN